MDLRRNWNGMKVREFRQYLLRWYRSMPPTPSVARGSDSLPGLDIRDNAAADPGKDGNPLLQSLSRAFPEHRILGQGCGARGSGAMVGSRVLQQSPKHSSRGKAHTRKTRGVSRGSCGNPRSARNRALHGRSGLFSCFPPGSARCGRKHPARYNQAGGNTKKCA